MSEHLNAEQLNLEHSCLSLDRNVLSQSFEQELSLAGFYSGLIKSHPFLFSDSLVFLSKENLNIMTRFISTIESVLKLPQVKSFFLHNNVQYPSSGACMGYDFHLTSSGPKLIEINTNAGGLFLNALLANSHSKSDYSLNFLPSLEQIKKEIYEMFISEWCKQGRSDRPKRIAIVDDTPLDQFLYPEFLLYQELLIRNGIDAIIVDPLELKYNNGDLTYKSIKIDMIYNRLTDFLLSRPHHQVIREAYLSNSVVLTPAPHNYLLFAKKDNLSYLSDENWLTQKYIERDQIDLLTSVIPKTLIFNHLNQSNLWSQRKNLFFKPIEGYGSKAVYQGSKLTSRVWGEIQKGLYIAQEFIPPSSRLVEIDQEKQMLKTDFRCYTYQGKILLIAARLYRGQVTNFRTEGGGFASVVIV